jgi:hypothetical protein
VGGETLDLLRSSSPQVKANYLAFLKVALAT